MSLKWKILVSRFKIILDHVNQVKTREDISKNMLWKLLARQEIVWLPKNSKLSQLGVDREGFYFPDDVIDDMQSIKSCKLNI